MTRGRCDMCGATLAPVASCRRGKVVDCLVVFICSRNGVAFLIEGVPVNERIIDVREGTFNTSFSETDAGRYVPRAIFVGFEPIVVTSF